jgi:glyoxylase-like metal-dependent hydrolase (beta-lactamase superfamily II)
MRAADPVQVGDWKVTLIQLASVTRSPTEFVHPDSAPRRPIQVAVNALLLQSRRETILVDSGIGVMAPIFGLETDIESALASQGLLIDGVSAVVLTHLDGDHVGGTMKGSWPDDLEPVFPNARVFAPRLEIEWSAAGGSGNPIEGGAVATRALDNVLEPLEANAEVAQGIRVRPAPGHTPGLCMIEIDGDRPLVFISDVLHARFLAAHPVEVVVDRDPEMGLRTRRRLLIELADSPIDVYASHIPANAPDSIVSLDAAFAFQSDVELGCLGPVSAGGSI